MEFFALKNLDSRFRRVRAYAIIFASLCLAGLLYTVHASYRFAERQREKIYVLDRGKSLLLALSQDQATNRPVEAREHVRRFHELFFTLSPDAEAIKENVERALALCDESGYSYYQDLLEKGYYRRVLSGGVLQRVLVDSIQGDYSVYPYAMRYFGKQVITRASGVTVRQLETSCSLEESSRSDANPQGFLIRNFTVIRNE